MDTAAIELAHRLADKLHQVMPQYKVDTLPEPFTFRHTLRYFKAVLTGKNQSLKLILRQSETLEAHQREQCVYTEILPHLSIRTPHLWASFTLTPEDTHWLVLEAVEGTASSGCCIEDRARILSLIGQLHRDGIRLRTAASSAPAYIFDPHSARHQRWIAALEQGLAEPSFNLKPWIVPLLKKVLHLIESIPVTLLHGDLDLSNILLGEEVILIDWEKCCYGPLCLDLGELMDHVGAPGEWENYRSALYPSSISSLSLDEVIFYAEVGWAYRLYLDVCSYVYASLKGKAPSPQWRENYYAPSLIKLGQIHHKLMDVASCEGVAKNE